MSLFGAKLGWINQCITLHSGETTIPAAHGVDPSTTVFTVSSAGVASASVASVHVD